MANAASPALIGSLQLQLLAKLAGINLIDPLEVDRNAFPVLLPLSDRFLWALDQMDM